MVEDEWIMPDLQTPDLGHHKLWDVLLQNV
jgi:hypothetical protein